MGDQLNKDLIEKVFNCKVICSRSSNADIIAIGSGLKTYLYGQSAIRNIRKFIENIFIPKVNVWGTGFIDYTNSEEKFYKSKITFLAVRGELTRKRVEKITNKQQNIPTGDGGLLSSFLLDRMPTKKYELGIIAHFREKQDPFFAKLLNRSPKSIFIDVQDTPENVTRKIAECETIISSSLHGLIISDSLNIPNIHLIVTDKLLGDGYKFDDYYSSYGLRHNYITNKDLDKISSNYIIKSYSITKSMVDKKKTDLIKSFPCEINDKIKDRVKKELKI